VNYQCHDLVKSCYRLESGLRFGQEGIHACQLGQLSSPLYWSADEASKIKITKEMIVEKRKWLFELLNNGHNDIACKSCYQVKIKRYADVNFARLGRIDLAATTICNLRCSFCGYTKHDAFYESKYDALAILKEFTANDVEWDSAVDFNGGEPALLSDLDEYLEFFASQRIRVLLYTNAVRFRQSIYDGLANGSLQWVCTSLDSGSPLSFMRLKKRDYFLQVLENLSRYAHAGNQGGGMLAVKYIFCDDNCDDDNIAGFTYAMLAIRPQKIWLTFDFEPLCKLPGDSSDFGGYDYSRHVKAYTKMYGLMKKHGLTAVHYTEGHLAAVSQHGKILLEKVLSEIKKSNINETCGLILLNSRQDDKAVNTQASLFRTMPLRIKIPNQDYEPWSLRGKRVVIAPACPLSAALLVDQEVREGNILGFIDRDPVLQGKSIQRVGIYGYNAIKSLEPEVVLVASPKQHRNEIVRIISNSITQDVSVVMLDTD
jgi:hypothetical protein